MWSILTMINSLLSYFIILVSRIGWWEKERLLWEENRMSRGICAWSWVTWERSLWMWKRSEQMKIQSGRHQGRPLRGRWGSDVYTLCWECVLTSFLIFKIRKRESHVLRTHLYINCYENLEINSFSYTFVKITKIMQYQIYPREM